MSRIDVYKEWLQIAETTRPLNYYQLLKLKPFEDNSGVIRKQYRQLNAHVRKYASGEFGAESQQLLNELAKAMLCLTDQQRKAEYDVSLGRKGTETVKRRRSLEDILLLNKIVPEDRMKQIKNYADTLGIDLQQAVLQQKLETAKPEIVMLAYAESIGLPFISLDDVGVDEAIAPQINPNTARQHSFVPVMADQGQLILASPSPVNPDVEEELRMLFEMPVRCAICTPAQINDAIAKYYPKDAVQMVAKGGKKGAEPTAKAAPKKSKPAKDEGAEEEDDEPVGPMSEAAKKVRTQGTMIAGCMSIGLTCFGCFTFLKVSPLIVYGAAALVACVASGITWMVLSKGR